MLVLREGPMAKLVGEGKAGFIYMVVFADGHMGVSRERDRRGDGGGDRSLSRWCSAHHRRVLVTVGDKAGFHKLK